MEFDTSGVILGANDNYLRMTGYTADELVGQHHRVLCQAFYAASKAYEQFWQKLTAGEHHRGEMQRLGKDGKDLWLEGICAPVTDSDGQIVKIVEIASDVTKAKLAALEQAAKLQALDRSQAVIEFDLNGNVLRRTTCS